MQLVIGVDVDPRNGTTVMLARWNDDGTLTVLEEANEQTRY